MKSIITIYFLLFALPLMGQSSENIETARTSNFTLRAETSLPVFAGVGLGYTLQSKFDFALFYGLTPEAYYKLIGQAAVQFGGNSSYDDVIEAAFQNNKVIKAMGNYFFDKKGSGYSLGLSFYTVNSSGKAPIDTVLAASTGSDYSTLKNLLAALGRSTEVDLSGTLQIFEIRGGYDIILQPSSVITLYAGLAKVINADVKLKTGLTNFEASAVGNSLMRQSESDLEKIITDNGLSPVLGVDYSYIF